MGNVKKPRGRYWVLLIVGVLFILMWPMVLMGIPLFVAELQPVSEESVTPRPTSPVKVSVEIEKSHIGRVVWKGDDWVDYEVIGVVVNKGNVAVDIIEVTLKLYDPEGRLIGMGSETIAHLRVRAYATLMPGCKIPFKVEARALPGNVHHYSLSVEASPAQAKPLNLKIVDVKVALAASEELWNLWRVEGTVTNEGDRDAENVGARIALYSEEDSVIGIGPNLLLKEIQPVYRIPPGEKAYFLIEAKVPKGENPAKVLVYLEGEDMAGYAELTLQNIR